jgi:hypothetical protein
VHRYFFFWFCRCSLPPCALCQYPFLLVSCCVTCCCSSFLLPPPLTSPLKTSPFPLPLLLGCCIAHRCSSSLLPRTACFHHCCSRLHCWLVDKCAGFVAIVVLTSSPLFSGILPLLHLHFCRCCACIIALVTPVVPPALCWRLCPYCTSAIALVVLAFLPLLHLHCPPCCTCVAASIVPASLLVLCWCCCPHCISIFALAALASLPLLC